MVAGIKVGRQHLLTYLCNILIRLYLETFFYKIYICNNLTGETFPQKLFYVCIIQI